MTTYAVTGARGYVGSRIAGALRRHGKVKGITRDEFTLGGRVRPQLLAGIDVLVHCAYDFRPRSWDEIQRVNVKGTLALFDAARRAGVKRIIFISSMSAFEGCRSKYGRAKLMIERQARKHHPATIIVRPGLVYDDHPGSIFGAMRALLRRLPVVPVIGGDAELYLVHSSDLGKAVAELSSTKTAPHGPVTLAAPTPHRFKDILKEMTARDRRRVIFIPVHWRIAYAGLRVLEMLRIPLPLRSDSIIGLVHADSNPSFPPRLKTRFREFTLARR